MPCAWFLKLIHKTSNMKSILAIFIATSLFITCNNESKQSTDSKDSTVYNDSSGVSYRMVTADTNRAFPAPFATPSVRNMSKVIGWPSGRMPMAPQGFTVSLFADNLDGPRWIYPAENGDIFVALADREGKKGNSVLLFRDENKDGVPESKSVYLSGLNQPFGMLIMNNKFYVANTDAVQEYPYDPKSTTQTNGGKVLLSLPAKGRHWTRNIVGNSAHTKIYITVGSSSNVAENGIDKETRRANILEVNADGSGERVFASGLRNPVGLAWAPGTNTLWTAVNERDELGDDLVPDYITSVKEGGFYGWPYSYFGQHEDPRIKDDMKRPDLVKQALVPDVDLGSHTASLGLAFYTGTQFPAPYREGAFVGQHGSWNRSQLAGYKVVFVPINNGKPSGKPIDFLTGFIADEGKSEVYGRPVGVAVLADGSLLVADDGAGKIWRVSYTK
jgi:glucose/arabinose dehydrogenase